MADFATWNAADQRFEAPLVCPEPGCGVPVRVPTAEARALGWCPACKRPFERRLLRAKDGRGDLVVHRRATALWCTQTGQALVEHSLLDWGEAGGGPTRCNSVIDPAGALFQPPGGYGSYQLERAWERPTELHTAGNEDHVVQLSVVRGALAVTSAAGRLVFLDPATGAVRAVEEWRGERIQPWNKASRLRQPPAWRGGVACLQAPGEAWIRDLSEPLLGRAPNNPLSVRVEPGRGRRFVGPPLGADGEEPLFVLLEGEVDRERQSWAGEPLLRIYNQRGEARGEVPAPGIARPPVYDPSLRAVLWVDEAGAVWDMPLVFGPEGLRPTRHTPAEGVHLAVDQYPLAVIAPDLNGAMELWVVSAPEGGEVQVLGVPLAAVRGEHRLGWRWSSRRCKAVAPVTGLGVGWGSRAADNAVSDLIVLTTPSGIRRLSKSAATLDEPCFDPVGAQGAASGSYDPPLLCGAGVIARAQHALQLDGATAGREGGRHSAVPLRAAYGEAQGLAVFGRRVFVGHGVDVLAADIVWRNS